MQVRRQWDDVFKVLERSYQSRILCPSKIRESSKREVTLHTRSPVRLPADFLSETLEARRQWANIFEVLKKKTQPRFLLSEKLSFKNEGEVKTFSINKS